MKKKMSDRCFQPPFPKVQRGPQFQPAQMMQKKSNRVKRKIEKSRKQNQTDIEPSDEYSPAVYFILPQGESYQSPDSVGHRIKEQ